MSTKKKKNPNPSSSLGPVDKLSAHVQENWWRNIFNANYLKTDADVVEDIKITQEEIDGFIEILNLQTDHKILDLCCGQGRHTLELAQRGYQYVTGFDRSHYLIQKARTRSKKMGMAVKFKEGDARKIYLPNDSFDVIMILGNSFGYFEAEDDDLKVLKEVFRLMKPGGRLLMDITDGDFMEKNFDSRSWEWIDHQSFVCRERSVEHKRLISREVITHTTKGVLADQFYAERLYSKNDLQALLKKAGFSNVTLHGEINTKSSRNQDLGMMGHRLIFTAEVIKEWTKIEKNNQKPVNVVVLLGDPSKNDIIKPDTTFDDDDFYTINQLKDALSNINGYKFNFLNNHNQFISDLVRMKDKTDFVFNLCDEGYDNDARKELHVPALLEMLKIPYSGGNPQCLAYCYDKSLVRGIAQEMDIQVPKAFFVKPEDSLYELMVDLPVIVKPNFGDSSFGITQNSVAHSIEELINAINEARAKCGMNNPVLVEELLTGSDISVGIIGNLPDNYRVLPVIEEDYSALPEDLPKICGYEAKWLPDSPYWKIKSKPIHLPAEVEKQLVSDCLKLMERLGCKDYCRFDWRLDGQGTPKLLEVNPNPGWCWDGHLAKMAAFDDMTYKEMLEAIVQATANRIKSKVPVN